MKRVFVFSGPSGGHLYPAQAFAEAAHDAVAGFEVTLVTSIRAKGLCSKFPSGIFSKIVYLPEFGAPAFSAAGLKSILRIPSAMIQSWHLITRIRPHLCIGFGSFVSYFGVLFASWRGIPTLIHEQNQVPGKATRMLQNTVDKIALSFPQTNFKKAPRSQTVFTGLPIRKALREKVVLLDQKPSDFFTVLVCGGSQGSDFLNRTVLQIFSCFSPEERSRFAVIHIAGMGSDTQVRESYAKLAMRAEVYPFFEEMTLLYNRAQVAISRAGANSSFEQALYGIPTIFIPYPYAEGHQNDNALYFVRQNAALMQSQNEQAVEGIAGILRDWEKQPESYWMISQKIRELSQTNGHGLLLAAAQNLLKNKP